MHLVEYTDEPKEWESLNYYLCNLIGITKTRCKKREVVSTIQNVLKKYQEEKIRVKYIYGGGKSLEGIYAYYDAVAELNGQCDKIDHVFLACGTGTTLTGICAGMQRYYPNAIVHAISTARRFKEEKEVLKEDIGVLNGYLGTSFNFDNLEFSDSFLCGGYAKYNNELFSILKECLSHEGMIIDPTYSGKAFYGMVKTVEASIDRYVGKNLLFWNTGGLFNLLSTKYDNEIK
jgi:D-cysteine desulfhydrase